MKLTTTLTIILSIFFLAGLASADSITLSPQEGHSNQDMINEALEDHDEVILSAGIYEVDGSTIIKSGKTLKGEKGAVMRVWNGSDQWNNRYNGVIRFGSTNLHDVEVSGIEIDGNCDELPTYYANIVFPGASGHHNAWRGIVFSGSSDPDSGFMYNISIHDMYIHDFFSDGVRIAYAYNVYIYDNVIENTQHEGIYLVCVGGGIVQNNKIYGITSDDVRFDNCVDGKIGYNYLGSYSGDHNNGATKGRHNGVQIANQGRSFDSGDPNQPLDTTNIEVTQNTLEGEKKRNFWIDSTGLGVTNVYIHDNKIVDGESLETDGFSIDGLEINGAYVPTGGYPDGGDVIDYNETDKSDDINNIFDILNKEFTDTGVTNQTADDIDYKVVTTSHGKIAGGIKIIGFKDMIYIDGVPYIPSNDSVLVKYRAIKSPDLVGWIGHVDKIEKNVTVEVRDGIAYANLTVKMKWYTIGTLPDGSTNKKYKTSTATFTDSCTAPEVLSRESTSKAYIHVYEDTKNPFFKVKIPYSNNTQMIEISYDKNKTTHKLMIGERVKGENNVIHTRFSRCDRWYGFIPHMGNELIIYEKFDKSKLNIEYFTPYESFTVSDIEVVYHKTKEVNHNKATLQFILHMILIMIVGYKLMDTIIN